jgi:predicted DNA-binding transcriptional regulator AlpA
MKFQPPPGWVPPFQDLRTLAQHVCLSEHTIENLVKAGMFPKPRKDKCGKRMWVWKEVEAFMSAPEDGDADRTTQVREATRRLSHA